MAQLRLLSLTAIALLGCAIDETSDDAVPTATTTQEVSWTDTLEEYAAKCDAATGLHVPQFDCDDMNATSPGGQDIVNGKCATPNVLNGACDPGSKFRVLAQNADAAVVAHCRKKGLLGAGQFGDIAVIQHNKKNGATCFYQALGTLDGTNVRPPSEGQLAWSWKSPAATRLDGCTGCHDNGAFIRSPYLAQINSGPNALPSVAAGYNNLTTPLRYVGADFANDRSWSVTAPAAPCPPGQVCTPCTACHRLAVNNFNINLGTAAQYALTATAQTQSQKFDHGWPTKLDKYKSPIWMRPGQGTYSVEAEQSALNHKTCATGFAASNFTSAPPGCTAEPLASAYTPGINGGARGDDIAVLGSNVEGAGITAAFSNDDGSFAITNTAAEYFGALAKQAGVQRVSGDFNKDGRTDFALVGGAFWTTIPVAMSTGDGQYQVTNANVGTSFNAWARTPGAKALSGDFNKDGFADIALTGAVGWASIPVAFSTGGGNFQITNQPAGSFGGLASTAGAKIHTGDFNKDGFTDIALTGVSWWAFIPIAFSTGGGSWQITLQPTPNFQQWAATANVKALAGDFNRDGYTDIALTGGAGWQSIPVAFSAGGGSFIITNSTVPFFPALASTPNVTPLVGDFNKDGFTDIALTGGAGWTSIPIAMSANGGAFTFSNGLVGDFGAWASSPGARPLVGDFNGDGFSDIALTGVSGWGSIPVALSIGWGFFDVRNREAQYFPAISPDPSATVTVGRLN